MRYHPRLDENGNRVPLHHPSTPSPIAAWSDPGAIARVVPDGPMPAEINGIAVADWTAPDSASGWEGLAGPIGQPPFMASPGRRVAAGVAIIEPDGRVWAMAPSNAHGGYVATFPKGRAEPGASLAATALKEAYEETGLQLELSAFLIDVERTTTQARYFLARRIGGNPARMGWEAQAVLLVPLAQLNATLPHPSDAPVIAALQLLERQRKDAHPDGGGPRT